uniref:Uncharacterized protein n=1 Tax=Aegilops tauschii subsp. strangulata TaxID=200361 RepID=A0A452ZE68_AEGTS
AAEGVERCKEQMQAQIERVLPLSRALAAAHRQVQDAKEGLSAERARLGDLQRLLRTRQQSMVAQVAALYPVRVFRDLPVAQNHHSRTNGRVSNTFRREWGTSAREWKWNTFAQRYQISTCWPLDVFWLANWKAQDKAAELQSQGASEVSSCAWICRASEASSMASTEHRSVDSADSKLTDYPLFLEYQDDSTKASYAIYLLQKDTEQLLNYIGAESSGRNAFGNLQELIRIIQSDEYLYI